MSIREAAREAHEAKRNEGGPLQFKRNGEAAHAEGSHEGGVGGVRWVENKKKRECSGEGLGEAGVDRRVVRGHAFVLS